MPGAYLWSQTAAANATVDGTVNWAEGQAPSSVNDSARAMMASFAKWRDDLAGATVTGGNSTEYTLATAQTFTSYVDKAEIAFSPHTDCGATVTIQVDGLTPAKPLRSAAGVELAAGALKSGGSYRARYRSAGNEFILLDYYSAPLAAGSVTTSMLADANVTYAKIQNVAASRLLGNPTGSAAAPSEIAIGGGLFFTGTTLKSGIGRGGISGCIVSNSSGDPANDIDIAAGVCRDAANSVDITVAAMTGKQLDANWVAGSSAGMRSSAAGITNTTYHIYAVAKADGTQDVYAHTSTTVSAVLTALQAEPGGSGYIYARRIFSIVRVAGAIRTFIQWGDYVKWKTTGSLDVNASGAGVPETPVQTATLSVPTGIRVMAVMNVELSGSAAAQTVYITPTDVTNKDAAKDAAPLGQLGTESAAVPDQKGQVMCLTNTSGQVSWDTNNNNGTLRVYTDAYYDMRGKDD